MDENEIIEEDLEEILDLQAFPKHGKDLRKIKNSANLPRIDCEDAACLVIDVVEGWKWGTSFEKACRDTVDACRAEEVPVIHCRDICGDLHSKECAPPAEYLGDTTNDFFVNKRKYSAFFGTDLDYILRRYGVGFLFIIGTETDVCVANTVADAWNLGYGCLVVADACADRDEVTDATFAYIQRYYKTYLVGSNQVKTIIIGPKEKDEEYEEEDFFVND